MSAPRPFSEGLLLLLLLLLLLFTLTLALDVQMNALYAELPFADDDGGVWKQGWPLTNPRDWTASEPLEVFVVMHSHTDPGWIKTFAAYYHDQVQGILDSTLEACSADARNHFIYAEMSFFSTWWRAASPEQLRAMRTALDRGQFEIVAGGWVMNDEATVHYAAAINQYLTGHEWLWKHVGYKPRSGWAIDPFGHSPTMTYLYAKMQFEHTLIQRVHYAVKKQLARHQQLEFDWRQQWESDADNTDFFTHLMPFYSYDIPHTCGPDPSVCSLFDFSTLGARTPWGGKVVALTDANIGQMAAKYVDQVQKKATLYKTHNRVLVLLGDDFKYTTSRATTDQTVNHNKLHDYINSNPEFHTHIRFATLSQYFDSVREIREDREEAQPASGPYFPVLKGDFFTYADVRQDYWSGFFTSRPFWKLKGRDLEALLRAAEISYAWVTSDLTAEEFAQKDLTRHFPHLLKAREVSGLFQHHDAMTGTSKTHVMDDYGTMLHESLQSANRVLEASVAVLVARDLQAIPTVRVSEAELAAQEIRAGVVFDIAARQEIVFVLFNPASQRRVEVVSIVVNSGQVEMSSSSGEPIPMQLAPFLVGLIPTEGVHRLYFQVTLPALSIARYHLSLALTPLPSTVLPRRIFAVNSAPVHYLGCSSVAEAPAGGVKFSSSHVTARFDPASGLLQAVEHKKMNSPTGMLKLDLVERFQTYANKESGVYLFMPEGTPRVATAATQAYLAMDGPLVSTMVTAIEGYGHRVVNLYHTRSSTLEVVHHTNLHSAFEEFTWVLASSIVSHHELFTDLQGLQMKRSVMRSDRPLGFNFYPVTSQAFIQDLISRFTVHTDHPLAVASLHNGELELLLDRRLLRDDNKGVGQGITDNLPFEQRFLLSFEETPVAAEMNQGARFPSQLSLALNRRHNQPVQILSVESPDFNSDTLFEYRSLLRPLSSVTDQRQLDVVALKVRDPEEHPRELILILFRSLYDLVNPKKVSRQSDRSPPPDEIVQLDIDREFAVWYDVAESQEHSLTLLHPRSPRNASPYLLDPMDLLTLTLTLTPRRPEWTPLDPPLEGTLSEPDRPLFTSILPLPTPPSLPTPSPPTPSTAIPKVAHPVQPKSGLTSTLTTTTTTTAPATTPTYRRPTRPSFPAEDSTPPRHFLHSHHFPLMALATGSTVVALYFLLRYGRGSRFMLYFALLFLSASAVQIAIMFL
eukprot:TRINITY_DN8673_c0_g1_i1.p1 TRINITY_DN8673_c0_g1~~TRINITY_DN8673_c0_g1_i1.p1  ORF type:complete len:1206 (-),score=136.11 TRINITY_DN8673_c0_g1_i1:152-3748(-)